ALTVRLAGLMGLIALTGLVGLLASLVLVALVALVGACALPLRSRTPVILVRFRVVLVHRKPPGLHMSKARAGGGVRGTKSGLRGISRHLLRAALLASLLNARARGPLDERFEGNLVSHVRPIRKGVILVRWNALAHVRPPLLVRSTRRFVPVASSRA